MKTPSLVYTPNTPGVSKLQPIGLQPFPRPGNQKAYAVQLENGENYSAHKMLFQQTRKGSEYIYNMFEGGELLFPPDPINDKAKEILEGRIFSQRAAVDIWLRYKFPLKPKSYINKLTFQIAASSPYEFTAEELSQFQGEWQNGGRETFDKQIGPTYLTYRELPTS